MDKARLKQLGSLIDEIAEERSRLTRDRERWAKIERLFGVGCLFGCPNFTERENRLARKLTAYEGEADSLRDWIDGVRDSITRRALRLRYLDGLSWADAARRMGYADESGPRKLVERLLAGEK